jgi:hypothetical protein
MKKYFIFIFLLFNIVFGSFLIAEDTVNNIRIDHISSIDYPRLKVYVSVEDKDGNPNPGLVKGNFTAKVDTEDPIDSIVVESFKSLEEPVHYVFFLSVSGLMDGKPLAAQKKALLDFTEKMKENDTLSAYLVGEKQEQIFAYKTALDVPVEIVQALEVNESQAKIFDSVVGTVRQIAKDKSTDLLKKSDRVVFLMISDGRDNESRYTLEQTENILMENGIPLYSVGLKVLSEASLSVLNELSEKSGGFYYYTRNSELIEEKLELFVNQINMSYVVSMKVRGIPPDDSFHQLMIQIDEKNQSSQAYWNFLAVKNPFPRWLKITLIILAIVLFVLFILFLILRRRALRKRLGIGKRKCPDCKRRMKDDWEFCPFCRYLPPKKKKGKKNGESASK